MTNIHIPPQVIQQSSVEELAFIGHRLHELSAKDLLVLKGALGLNAVHTPQEFINSTYQLEDYRLCLDVEDMDSLGRFACKYMGRSIQEGYSYTKLGLQTIDRLEYGRFIEGGYVYQCSDSAPKPYDGQNLSELGDHFYSVKLRLADPKGQKFCSLRLPDMSATLGLPDEVEAAKIVLGVESLEQCRLVDAKCTLLDVDNLLEEYKGRLGQLIEDGNRVGWFLWRRDSAMSQLSAAMDHEECYSLGGALDIVDRLKNYAFTSQQGPEMEMQ